MLSIPSCYGNDRGEKNSESLTTFVYENQFVDGSNEAIFQDHLSIFLKARGQAVLVNSDDTESIEIGKHYIMHYHRILESVAPRLYRYDQLGLDFHWGDAVMRSRQGTASRSIYYDWSNVLWNLGSMESLEGATTNRDTEEGIKKACKHFIVAASVFEYIALHTHGKISGTNTITQMQLDLILMAKFLMLAQAQLCFYEKAIPMVKEGKIAAKMIASIALSCAQYYQQTVEYCEKESIRVRLRFLDSSWSQYCQFQQCTFAAAAEYWQSIQVKEGALKALKGFGEEITRLGIAQRHIRQALGFSQTGGSISVLAVQSAQTLSDIIEEKYEQAANDNRAVYFDAVPSENEIVSIEPMSMVATGPLPSYGNFEYLAGGMDEKKIQSLFSFIIPSHLKIAALRLQEQADKLYREGNDMANEATGVIRAKLASLSLPGNVEAYKSGDTIPESTWSKISDFQRLGGLKHIQGLLSDLLAASKDRREQMADILQCMKKEEQADASFRSKHAGREELSMLQSVMELFVPLKQELKTFENSLEDACSKDSYISNHVYDPEYSSTLNILENRQEDLNAMLPVDLLNDDYDASEAASHPQVLALEQILFNIVDLISTRNDMLAQLNDFAKGDMCDLLLRRLNTATSPSSQRVAATVDKERRVSDLSPQQQNERSGEGEGEGEGEVWKEVGGTTYEIASCTDEAVVDIIEKHRSLLTQLAAGIELQNSLYEQVVVANDAFLQCRKMSNKLEFKDKLMKDIEEALCDYSSIEADIQSGLLFYDNLKTRLDQLKNRVEDTKVSTSLYREQCSDMIADAAQEAADLALAQKLSQESNVPPAPPAYMHQQHQQLQLQVPVSPHGGSFRPLANQGLAFPGGYPGAVQGTPMQQPPVGAMSNISFNQNSSAPSMAYNPQQQGMPNAGHSGNVYTSSTASYGSGDTGGMMPAPSVSGGGGGDLESKVSVIVSMGIADRTKAMQYLIAFNGDEQAASEAIIVNAPLPQQGQGGEMQNQQQPKKAGLFGRMWGK